MKEENNGASKNKWSRIFRKKWFFPAVYLTIAALLLTAVVWYQNLDNQVQDQAQDQEQTEDYTPNPADQDAKTVVGQQEVVKMPVENQDKAEIVTKFYDYNSDEKAQESALVLYNNRYYQSTGIDIASTDGETFNVTAALSGTVTDVKEDPLLGNVVELTHENDVTTYYASLDEVSVQADDEVKQGDVLGTAGKNLFGKDSGVHVHFELRKDGQEVNPEAFFNQPVSSLDTLDNAQDESEATEESETTDESNATEDSSATEESNATEESGATDESDATSDDSTEQPVDSEEDPNQNQDEETNPSDDSSTDGTTGSSASSASA